MTQDPQPIPTDAPASPARRIILASASPRRQELLRDAGYEFLVHPANVNEESYPPGLLPSEIARHLSLEKAKAVAETYPTDLVLGADTVVAFGDHSLGKPENVDQARTMLTLLSGTTHVVITGVTLICRHTGLEQTRHAMSAVRMRSLTPRQIDSYVASHDWQGKAGGYGIQDRDPFVTNMKGSHSNIVGLPMELVAEMLAHAGVFPKQ